MKLRNKKTGEIIKDAQYRTYSTRDGFVISTSIDKYPYKSLKEFCEDWEDYVPKEPLIKDEKIRKAVRAWADGNNIESVHYDAFWTGFRRDNSSITVWEELPLEDNKVYTIAELCGEEEE